MRMPSLLIDFQNFYYHPLINSTDTSCGHPSLTSRKSQLLAVQAFRHKLGPKDALLMQIAWVQIANFAKHSGHEFRWTPLLRV